MAIGNWYNMTRKMIMSYTIGILKENLRIDFYYMNAPEGDYRK